MSPDAELLARFIDSAIAGRPHGFRRDDLQEALRRLVEQTDALVKAGDALCAMLATPNGPRANQLAWFDAKRAVGR